MTKWPSFFSGTHCYQTLDNLWVILIVWCIMVYSSLIHNHSELRISKITHSKKNIFTCVFYRLSTIVYAALFIWSFSLKINAFVQLKFLQVYQNRAWILLIISFVVYLSGIIFLNKNFSKKSFLCYFIFTSKIKYDYVKN